MEPLGKPLSAPSSVCLTALAFLPSSFFTVSQASNANDGISASEIFNGLLRRVRSILGSFWIWVLGNDGILGASISDRC